MKNYYDFLVLKGLKVNYINSNDENSDIRKFIDQLTSTEIDKIQCIDPEDNWLEKRRATVILKLLCIGFNLV
jgi:deoxyribodipyrimidine photolyase-related protein